MEPVRKPVIFLAFANDLDDRAPILRKLSTEHALVREYIERAVKDGLCELKELYNATLSGIIDVFQDVIVDAIRSIATIQKIK